MPHSPAVELNRHQHAFEFPRKVETIYLCDWGRWKDIPRILFRDIGDLDGKAGRAVRGMKCTDEFGEMDGPAFWRRREFQSFFLHISTSCSRECSTMPSA